MGASPLSTPFSQLSCYRSSSSVSSLSQLQLPEFCYRRFSPAFTVTCALSRRVSTRRLVSVSLFSLYCNCSIPKLALAGGFDKYLKRKKLDPLEAYVPAVILTQLQIEDLGKILDVDKPQYATYRNLLRSGPAASLRVNIRVFLRHVISMSTSAPVANLFSALRQGNTLLSFRWPNMQLRLAMIKLLTIMLISASGYSVSLPWSTRMKIVLGAAKGLAFLHEDEKPVIYRDFKASNILLDSRCNKVGERCTETH